MPDQKINLMKEGFILTHGWRASQKGSHGGRGMEQGRGVKQLLPSQKEKIPEGERGQEKAQLPSPS